MTPHNIHFSKPKKAANQAKLGVLICAAPGGLWGDAALEVRAQVGRLRVNLPKMVAHGGIAPFWSWQGPWESHVRFRTPQGRNPSFGLAPQAHLRKAQGFLALVVMIALGIVLGSGTFVRLALAAPSPVANSCGLDSPPGVGVVPMQAPGPGRPQHPVQAGAQGALQLVQCRDGTQRINTQSIKSTSMGHAMHLCASTNRYRSIYPTIT